MVGWSEAGREAFVAAFVLGGALFGVTAIRHRQLSVLLPLGVGVELLGVTSLLQVDLLPGRLLGIQLADMRVLTFLGSGFAFLLVRHGIEPIRPRHLGLAACGGGIIGAVGLYADIPSGSTVDLDASDRAATILLIAAWTGAVVLVVMALVRAAGPRTSLQRIRMRLVATGLGGFIAAMVAFAAAPAPPNHGRWDAAGVLLAVASTVLLALGLATPRPLRVRWQRRDEHRLVAALEDVVACEPDATAVLQAVVHWAVTLMGGSGAFVLDSAEHVALVSGLTIAEAHAAREVLRNADLRQPFRAQLPRPVSIVATRIPSAAGGGTLGVISGPWTPVFGSDDVASLRRFVETASRILQQGQRVQTLEALSSQLRAVDEQKEVLLSAVSHDLRNPLVAILGYCHLLDTRAEAMSPEDLRRAVHRIEVNATRIDGLLTDLLEHQRTAQPQAWHRAEQTDLAALTAAVVPDLDIPDTHHLATDLTPVRAVVDPVLIGRAVANLVNNACRHTPAGTKVLVTVSQPDEHHALIAVDDDGPGLPHELAETVFRPFERGNAPVAGSGLGLYLVARFAELHGGHAWVEPSPLGGASFRFAVPLVPTNNHHDTGPVAA